MVINHVKYILEFTYPMHCQGFLLLVLSIQQYIFYFWMLLNLTLSVVETEGEFSLRLEELLQL